MAKTKRLPPRIWFWQVLGCFVSLLMGLGQASPAEWYEFEKWISRRIK